MEAPKGGIDFVCTQPRGEGGLPKCVHSTKAYAVTTTSYCVQGGGGGQKGPCVHTKSMPQKFKHVLNFGGKLGSDTHNLSLCDDFLKLSVFYLVSSYHRRRYHWCPAAAGCQLRSCCCCWRQLPLPQLLPRRCGVLEELSERLHSGRCEPRQNLEQKTNVAITCWNL